MELPEGWKLFNGLNTVRKTREDMKALFKYTGADLTDEAADDYATQQNRLIEAKQFLKEMAEALESLDCVPLEEEKTCCKGCRVLKKFEEWK